MTELSLVLNDKYELTKSYTMPSDDPTVDYVVVELAEGSELATHISDYTFALVIKLPSNVEKTYTLTPDTGTKFEKLSVPPIYSQLGDRVKVYIEVSDDGTLIDKSSVLTYEIQCSKSKIPSIKDLDIRITVLENTVGTLNTLLENALNGE